MSRVFRFALSAALCGAMFAPLPALAGSDVVDVVVDQALATPYAKSKLDGSVKFYFGDTPHPDVVTHFQEIAFKEKAGFLKSNEVGCNEAFINALADFQSRAKSVGANAVINLRNFYKKNETAIDKTASCFPGGMRVGVTLKGELVKLAE